MKINFKLNIFVVVKMKILIKKYGSLNKTDNWLKKDAKFKTCC